MAGSSEERWRHSCRADLHGDEPEEGEIVPGDHSDVDTEEYYNRHSPLLCDDSDETISDCGDNAACSSAPASYGDDATSPPPPVAAANSNGGNAISSYPVVSANNNGGNASSSTVAAAAAAALACPICGKEFRSQKAVCGHMKVHQQHAFVGSQKDKGIKRAVVAVVGAWGGSGKRGCFGLGSKQQAASPNNGAGPDQSMAIVVAEPQIVLQPTPLAFEPPNPSPVPTASVTPTQSPVSTSPASPTTQSSPVPAATNVSGQSSTAQPTHNNGAMDTVAAGPANNPPPSDSEVVVQQHAAPPAPVVQRAAPIVVHQHQPAAAGRQNPNGYSCPECDMWFQTHQGLGGHVAGHRNREHAAAAAAGMAMVPGSGDDDGAPSCRRNGKPEKAHVCKVCGAVFAVGVQLGGHMRKHYAGPPIVPNKKPRLVQPLVALPPPAHTLALLPNAEADEAASPDAPALELPLQHDLAPTVERAPEPAPPVTATTVGRVLLFGIDIGVRVQKPAAQEEGPSETQGSASMEQ
ncbi:hypothetical protein HU200_047331 [Digitaria exilis]|uniref:C2H2-type domain-containing protein n=1 Tax=Digitaria exilis TaxID=1010633 RepID=A0A835B2G5_9POAL|nr:hypothetical protein HU200_047331 [Digitaria exilis]CAB3473773.1 unnamed protein product [Digitaria exilis]